MPRPLVESDLFEYKLKESGDLRKGVLAVVGGLGQRADEENANKRVYSKALWEKVLPQVREKIKARMMVGELDHPEGEGSVKNISHVVTEANLANDGTVYVEMEVLNTPQGQILKSLIEAGVRLGISSRGEGEIVNREGKDYVAEDTFVLDTWDVVINPSTRGAYPEVIAQRESEAKRVLRSVEATCNRNTARSVLLEGLRIVESLETKDHGALKGSVLQTIRRKLSPTTTAETVREDTRKETKVNKPNKADPSTARLIESRAKEMAQKAVNKYRKAVNERNDQIASLTSRLTVAEKRLASAVKIMSAMKEKAKEIALRSSGSKQAVQKYNELARRHAAAKKVIEDQHKKLAKMPVLEKRHGAALDIIDGFAGIHQKAKLRAFVESKLEGHPASKQIAEMAKGARTKKEALRIIESAKGLVEGTGNAPARKEPLPGGKGGDRSKVKVNEQAKATSSDPMMKHIFATCDR